MSCGPARGKYSGAGVSLNEFIVVDAGIAIHGIGCIYEDNNGCEFEITEELIEEVCDNIEQLSLEQIEL